MKEYTRRITGVIVNYERYPDVNGKPIGDIVAEMIGKGRKFAGTVSIVITDLTEDTGADHQPAGTPDPPGLSPDERSEEGSGTE